MASRGHPNMCYPPAWEQFSSLKDWAALARDLRRVYTAPTEAAAPDRFAEFSEVRRVGTRRS